MLGTVIIALYILTLNLDHITIASVLHIRKLRPGKLSNLPKVTQLGRSRASI